MNNALTIAVKDLRSDARAKQVVPTMVLFSLVLVFLFTFALPPGAGRVPTPLPAAGAVSAREVSGQFLWVAFLFAAVIGFGMTAAQEKEGSRIEGLILAPVDPAFLFAGKALANLAFLLLLQSFIFPAFLILSGTPAGQIFPLIIPVALAADIGLAAAGTLFAAASQYSRARALILPLLLFPMVLPAVLAASRLTSALLTTGGLSGEGRWFVLMLVYDVIFVTIGAVAFEFVIQE
ncbi:MAG: heme exporter protein CcmB [Actinomycetota bacterium]